MATIVRQDFLDGSPASLTELRAHSMNAASGMHGIAFQKKTYSDPATLPVEEEYDLVIVGAGLSGLSAAHFYRERFGADHKILIVDALDDFGGHAKRNEFTVDGKLLLGYGGSESLQSPKANFSPVAHGLLKSLGIDISLFESKFFLHSLYGSMGLSRASFFDGAKFGGKDCMVIGDPTPWVSDDVLPKYLNAQPLETFIDAFPMSDAARAQLRELYTSKSRVTLAHLPDPAARTAYLAKTNYVEFLRKDWGISDEALSYFQQRTLDFFGLPPNKVSALDAGHYGYPGVQGVEVPHGGPTGELSETYVHHFPDGNASIARMLVRKLIPSACPGSTMEDIVLSKFDYSKLDHAGHATRVRLNSTVVRVANAEDSHGKPIVHVGYIHNGEAQVHHVSAKHVVLACFNMVIPYLIPPEQLPADQAAALKDNVKAPLVYTNVVLRNWHPFVALKVHEIFGVSSFHSRVKLDYPVAMGDYSCARDPSQPVVVHMVHVPSVPDSPDPRTALRLARKTLFGKNFDHYERAIKEDLTKMLGPGGFDATRDIAAITVNRWSHGYAYGLNTLAESEEEGQKKMELARRPIGNITIANSDAGWSAYAHSAIDEAHRAVQELKTH